MATDIAHQPYIRIVEQPARSSVRFRYECEGRSAGPIPGVSSTPTCATYPAIQVCDFSGKRSLVVVSCVTVSPPYRQHPHHLVGRVGCHNGICSMIVENSDNICTFTHLGIQCAKRNEITIRLRQRKAMKIDPTNAGFEHINKSSRGVDLGCVRLCFQVFIEDELLSDGKLCVPLEPVISDPVYDKKLLSKLTITDISTNSVFASGGKVMLFCSYIDEYDIEVLFYECEQSGAQVWQMLANLKPPYGEVHKRVGMSFIAPAYHRLTITRTVQCYMQLRRTSDHEASDPIPFYYLPICHNNCPFVAYHYHQMLNSDNNKPALKLKYSKRKFQKRELICEEYDSRYDANSDDNQEVIVNSDQNNLNWNVVYDQAVHNNVHAFIA